MDRSSPAIRSIAGTITRITTGPIQKKAPQPVATHAPYPMKASDGTTSPISQRYRFLSFHCSVEPVGTVLLAIADMHSSVGWFTRP